MQGETIHKALVWLVHLTTNLVHCDTLLLDELYICWLLHTLIRFLVTIHNGTKLIKIPIAKEFIYICILYLLIGSFLIRLGEEHLRILLKGLVNGAVLLIDDLLLNPIIAQIKRFFLFLIQ